jgi:antitoxin VapB
MTHRAKVFVNGRSQAVRLPASYRFDAKEVFIRRDPETGDVILSRKPADWDSFLEVLEGVEAPPGFLEADERRQEGQDRDPFEGWPE